MIEVQGTLSVLLLVIVQRTAASPPAAVHRSGAALDSALQQTPKASDATLIQAAMAEVWQMVVEDYACDFAGPASQPSCLAHDAKPVRTYGDGSIAQVGFPHVLHSIARPGSTEWLITKRNNPGWDHRSYSLEEAAMYVQRNCPGSTEAYHTLVPTAFKADLARACILYTEGGVYIDDDIAVGPLDTLLAGARHSALLIQDRDVGGHQGVWNAFMVARPGQPFLKCVMAAIASNVQHRRVNFHGGYSGETLHVSGPHLYNDCIGRLDDVEFRWRMTWATRPFEIVSCATKKIVMKHTAPVTIDAKHYSQKKGALGYYGSDSAISASNPGVPVVEGGRQPRAMHDGVLTAKHVIAVHMQNGTNGFNQTTLTDRSGLSSSNGVRLNTADCALVLTNGETVVWQSNAPNSRLSCRTMIQENGNVVIVHVNGTVIWASETNSIVSMRLDDDGILRGYNSDSAVVWSRGNSKTVGPSETTCNFDACGPNFVLKNDVSNTPCATKRRGSQVAQCTVALDQSTCCDHLQNFMQVMHSIRSRRNATNTTTAPTPAPAPAAPIFLTGFGATPAPAATTVPVPSPTTVPPPTTAAAAAGAVVGAVVATTTTTAPLMAGAKTLTVGDTTGISANDVLTVTDGTNTDTSTVASVTADRRRAVPGSITLTTPLSNSYAAGATATFTAPALGAGPATCTPATPCASGVGDCDANDDCAGALVCLPSADGMLSGGGHADYCGAAASHDNAGKGHKGQKDGKEQKGGKGGKGKKGLAAAAVESARQTRATKGKWAAGIIGVLCIAVGVVIATTLATHKLRDAPEQPEEVTDETLTLLGAKSTVRAAKRADPTFPTGQSNEQL